MGHVSRDKMAPNRVVVKWDRFLGIYVMAPNSVVVKWDRFLGIYAGLSAVPVSRLVQPADLVTPSTVIAA